ncbi:thiol reductant ABC exporter subunit CydD [Bacillus coahuilensis]|nr:thiol reductant ABC exporter subunit CydD [Bacillus coahuilensis]
MNPLKTIAKSQKAARWLLMCLAVLSGATIIAQAYFFMRIVELVFLEGASIQEVVPYLGGLLGVLLLRATLSYGNGYIGIKMASKVKNQFREKLLSSYKDNPLQGALEGKSGEKVSLLVDAVDEIDSYFKSYVPQVIQTSIVPLMILMAVSTQHIYSGLIMMITAPFIPIFYIVVGINTQKKSEEQLEQMTLFSGRFLDTLQGLSTLKLFGQGKKQRDEIRKSSEGFRDSTMKVLQVAFNSSLKLEFISMLSIGLIALEIALRLVVFQTVTFSTAFFILILAPEFYQLLKELGSAFHTGRGSMGAAKKISEQLSVPVNKPVWGDRVMDATSPLSIEIQDLSFQYGDGFQLKEVGAELKPYENIAVVGRTGSGKTTLLSLIAGLLPPTSGTLLVNGIPLSHYRESEWFRRITYISQSPYLFSGTIRENIVIGTDREVSDTELFEACKKAGLMELIESFQHGVETEIGEGGRGLSGGEQQRVALARAFLKKPSLILFDEPTTGLDLQTERILQKSMKELSEYSTVITVAHRLHTIQEADRILFLENGQVLGYGTHEELLETVQDYREMIRTQQEGVAL